MGGATTILGAIIGYTSGGPAWMSAGAVAGWVIDAIVTVFIRASANRDAERIRVRVSKLRQSLEENLGNILGRLPQPGFYSALLDAQPLDHFEALHAKGLRTAEDWQALDAMRWNLLRRRLIQLHGFSPERVDEAKEALRMWNPERLPETEKDLIELIRRERAAHEWAARVLDNRAEFEADADAPAHP